MATTTADPLGPLTQRQEATIHQPVDLWSDDFAGKVAKRDYETAERFIASNHHKRWQTADELYLAWVRQKFWEGTRYPRSSLGVPVIFQQVEALMPHLMSSVFGDPYPFDAEPRPGTHPRQSRAVRDLMAYQLEEANVREVFRRTFKSGLIYGNGIVELGWLTQKRKRIRHFNVHTPVRAIMQHPIAGPVPVVTGIRHEVKSREVEEDVNRPFLRSVDIRDFFIDPNCPGPLIREARYAGTRCFMTVDELDALRKQAHFKIPDRDRLLQMAKERPYTQGDTSKSIGEAYRGVSWQPHQEESSDPGAKRIEVVNYQTNERMVWLLNRDAVCYNRPHPYGGIMLFNVFYVDVLGRFYGLSISDVNEGEQRLQQGMLNGRVDELALALHPPTVKRRGQSTPSYQLRRRPGLITEVDDEPNKSLVREQVQNVTQHVFIETEASERRSQKNTGITDLAVLGTPGGGGGNSANRSATGVRVQAQASGRRIEYLVENIEDTFIAPLLDAIHELNKRYLDPNQVLEVLGPDGQSLEIDPLDVKNADVKFSLRGASKLRARESLQQIVPMVMQAFMAPEFLSMLAQQQQKTIDIEEVANMIMDSAAYKPRSALFRQLTPEEQQAMNKPPAEETIRMEMQRERLQSQSANQDRKSMMDMFKEIVKAIAQEAVAEDKPDKPKPKKAN